MARFLLVLALTALASGFAVMAMPWWIVMPIAFVIILILPMRGGRSFLATGLGVAISFFIISFMADNANDHILSSRMAALFHLPSYVFMLVITALIGLITGGLGGWAAALLRNLFKGQRTQKEQLVSQQRAS